MTEKPTVKGSIQEDSKSPANLLFGGPVDEKVIHPHPDKNSRAVIGLESETISKSRIESKLGEPRPPTICLALALKFCKL
jgi:hypothetical protein